MATEEPSVIAAASYGAKIICENSKGFVANSKRNIMRGQIFFKNIKNPEPLQVFEGQRGSLIEYCNEHLCKSMT